MITPYKWGWGAGAAAVAFWGWSQGAAVATPEPSGGGGGYSRQIIHRHFEDDAEEIFMIMVNAFMRTQ